MDDQDELAETIAAVRQQKRLGRSGHLNRLFEFLAQSTLSGRSPKETEVAIEVFGRSPQFDPSRDAIARVYVHKLRQRLNEIADDTGEGDVPRALTIPRGEYRLALRDAGDEAVAQDAPDAAAVPAGRSYPLWQLLAAMAVAALVTLGIALGVHTMTKGHAGPRAVAASSPVWSEVIGNGKPTIVVLGDYYIFGDANPLDGTSRLVREFTVNSPMDLDRFIHDNPQRAANYSDLDLHYLPVGGAGTLMSVSTILQSARDLRTIPASSLTPTMMRDANIVYIGYFSGLGPLRAPVFAGSRYAIAETYDDILDTQTGRRFESGGGVPQPDNVIYDDYGYFSTFPGPTGNRFVIIVGARDPALAQMGQTIANPAVLDQLSRAGGSSHAAEALYGVKGLNEINFDSRVIQVSPLKTDMIWNDTNPSPKVFPEG